MRLLIVTDQYHPMVGGVPTVTRGLAGALAERGHTVTVLAPSAGYRSAAGKEGLASVGYVGSFRWPWYQDVRVAWQPRRVSAVISAAAPEVVHIQSPVVLGVLARRSARQAGVPVVYTNHYLPANVMTSPGAASRLLDRSFYSWVVGFANRCDYVTAPTDTALELLTEHGLRAPARVISNGVDTGAYAPGPADSSLRQRYGLRPDLPLVLSVGRLSGEKRIDVLLGAASRLSRPVQLAIAGTGPQDAALRALAARLGLADLAAFLGHVADADLPGLYRTADVFAISSEAELQSVATLEAMASGLPVVAADACALRELVKHRHNGYLFPPGCSGELAGYLELLAADPGMRQRMGAESLRIAAGHTRASTVAEWESVYALMAGMSTREVV